MIVHDVAQGSADWYKLRRGVPTASNFHRIITPKRGDLSDQADRYALELIYERLLQTTAVSLEGMEWVERGQELEPAAVRQYQFVYEIETVRCGFVTTDDGRFGASPDLLWKSRPIGVELKCPNGPNHLRYALFGHDDKYRPQVQGQMLVAELERVDFYSFHPRMPTRPIETTRDEAYIAKMRDALERFDERLRSMNDRARALGVYQAYETADTPVEIAHAVELEQTFKRDFGLTEDFVR